jgi:ABC-type dipeptide transport system, periplasmic component
MKKVLKLSLVLLIMVTVLVACSSPKKDPGRETVEDFTFIVRLSGDPTNFHPDLRTDDAAWPINQNLFNRLIKLGPKDNVVPDLAYEWEFSDDGLTLTFKLHENVKWHDGEPFTSADVKWTYDTMFEEDWRASTTLASIESIEIPDDYTVVMHLSYADASIISKLSWYGTFIMPKHLYEGTDQATNPYNQTPVGTGPFKFVSWDKGVSVTLERNDDFFGEEKAHIKTLIFSIIPDQNTAYQALLNGEIDYMDAVPSAVVGDLADDPNYTLVRQLGINRTYVTFNWTDPILSDIRIRQAIAYAINQKSICERTCGAGQQSETFISPVFVDFVDDTYKLPETDLEKAIALIEEAGYTKGSDGFYFEITLTFFISGNWEEVVAIIKANLAEVGIKVTLEAMEVAAWQVKVMDNYDFEMTMLAGYQGPDVSGVYNRVHTDGNTNIAKYSNPELDALLVQGNAETDPEKRAAIYSEVQRIMSEDLPLILILDNGYEYAFKNEFSGYPLQVPDKAASSEYTYVIKYADGE